MAGLVLWAFFLLGVMTGFSGPGRKLIRRASVAVRSWTSDALEDVAPLRALAAYFGQSLAPATHYAGTGHAAKIKAARTSAVSHFVPVALVERSDGFYALSANRELSGPVSPVAQANVPILSGPGAQNASPSTLVRYAAVVVRAEARLSELISEMRVSGDGTAALFLDRTPTEILIDLRHEPVEVRRAARVLHIWRSRERLVAVVDMTTPGLAVLRFNKANLSRAARQADISHESVASRGVRPMIAEADSAREPVMR